VPSLEPYDHVDPGRRAHPEKKALFSAIKEEEKKI